MSNLINNIKSALAGDQHGNGSTDAGRGVERVKPLEAHPDDTSSQDIATNSSRIRRPHINEPTSTIVTNTASQRGTDTQGLSTTNPMTGTGYTATGLATLDIDTSNKLDSCVGTNNASKPPAAEFRGYGQSISASHHHVTGRGTEAGITGSGHYETNDSTYSPAASTSGDADFSNRRESVNPVVMASETKRFDPGITTTTAGSHGINLQNNPQNNPDLQAETESAGARIVGSASATSTKPLDAASVPPSVMREHLGEPEIMHGDMSHNRAGRHQGVSEQESHRGI